MVSQLNVSYVGSSLDEFKDSLHEFSDEELNAKFTEFAWSNDPDAKDKAIAIMDEINARKNPEKSDKIPSLVDSTEALQKAIQEIRNQFEEQRKGMKRNSEGYKASMQEEFDKISEAFSKFVSSDVKGVSSTIDSLQTERDDAVKRLTDLLAERPSVTEAIKDTLGPKALRLTQVNKHIAQLKEDKDHYPNNVLNYVQRVSSSLLGTPFQRARGLGHKLSNPWVSDETRGSRFDSINDLLRDGPKDSPWKKALKGRLRQAVFEAQNAFVESAADRARKQVGLNPNQSRLAA